MKSHRFIYPLKVPTCDFIVRALVKVSHRNFTLSAASRTHGIFFTTPPKGEEGDPGRIRCRTQGTLRVPADGAKDRLSDFTADADWTEGRVCNILSKLSD